MEVMKIVLGRFVLLIVAVAATLSQDALAQTRFVKPNGNNNNDGTTWATAWAHPNKAQSALTTSGFTLVIAPGTYDTVQFVPPAAGGSMTSYVCSSYVASGSDAGRNNTFIYGGRPQTLTWTNIGGNLWTTTFDSPGGGVVSNNGEYVAFFRDGVTLRPRQTTAELNEQNEYAYNTAGGLTTLYTTTNPNSSAWRVCWRPVMFLGRGQSNVLVYGLNIQEGSQRLFILTESGSGMPKCDSIYIYHCNLSKVSDLQIAHNTSIVYCGEIGPATVSDWSNAIEVVGCTLSTVISVGEGTGVHAGSAIEYYFTRDSRIDSNVFVGPMSVAIALKMGCYPDNGNKSLNWSVKYNRISDCVDEAVWISNKVGNVDFIGNILERNECAFNIHTSSPCGNDPTQGNINVSHNTFIDNQVNFTASAANAIGGNKIMYNIFCDTVATAATNYEYTIGFRLRGGEAPLETPSTETYWANGINNNMYYFANGGETFAARFTSNSGFAGYPNPTWAQWRAHFDQASITGINPKFNASHLGDYSRPNSTTEFAVTEYGRTWTLYGAWQPDSPGCFPLIAAPLLVTPTDGATNQSPPFTFDWSDLSGSSNYKIEIDNDSEFTSPAVSAQSTVSTYSTSALSSGTTYYWRVAGFDSCGWGNWSAPRSLSTCNGPAAPSYVSPANGATGLAQPVVLDWSDLAGATLYQIQVDDNSGFSSTAVDQQVAASTYSVSGLPGGTLYYWRIRAQNSCGWGAWSAARSFSTCDPAVAPNYVSPANGATGVTQPVALDWSDLSGATLYQVQVDDNSSFTSTAIDQQLATSTYSASGLAGGTLYYWRMRAQNACGWGAWSAARTFTTSSGDATPPTISNVVATDITNRSAVITWTTSEPASTQINYGTSVSYGSSTTLISTLTTNHEQVITGLDSLKTYHFRVRSRDAASNEAVSGDYLFTTANSVGEGILPTVSSTYIGFSPNRITDGNLNPFGWEATTWAAESATLAHWVEVNFGASRTIQRVAVYWAWNSNLGSWMTSQQFRIQIWNGSAFTDVSTVNNVAADSCTFVEIAPVATSRIRYYQPANMGPSNYPTVVWLAELDFFGNSANNSAPTVPTMSIPADAEQLTTQTPTLILNNSSDPDGNAITYDFQISTSAAFTTITTQASGVAQGAGATTSWTVATALSSGTTYYWRVRSYDGSAYSSYSSSRSFSISVNTAPSVPNLTSPVTAGQVTTLTPTLTLTNSTDAQGNTLVYDFQVSTSTAFGTITAQATSVSQGAGGSTSWTVNPNLVNGTTYYWRARAYDGSLYSNYASYRSFTVAANNMPTTPTPSSPANGASVATLAPILVLNNSTDPDGDSLTYQFQVATSSGFSAIIAQASGVAQGSGTTSWTVTPNLSSGTTYYWRARAFDGSLASAYTATRTFSTVANSAPTVPTLSSPANSAVLTINAPALVVTNSTDANGDAITYSYQVATSSAFTAIVAQVSGVAQGTGSTSWTVTPSLASGSTYYWRARSYDGALYSNYSAYRTFSVNTNVAPGAPSPQLPLPNSRVIDFTPDLIANNATDPNNDNLTYQFYLYNGPGTTLLAQSSMTTEGDTSTAWTTSITLAPKTSYSWRVRANDGQVWSSYSTTRSFRTNRVPPTPVPSAPIDGDTVIGSMHEYIVLNSTDPDSEPLTYDFQVYADSLLTTLIESVSGVTPGPSQTSTIQNADLAPNRHYWWRARASDSTHSSNWCAAEKFYQMQLTLDITEAPSIVSPLDGASVEHIQPALIISWSGEPDSSTICLFELATSNTFEDLLLAGNVKSGGNTAAWTPDLVLSEGVYFWRAKRGESDYSKAASFSVVAPIYVSPNPFGYAEEGVVVHNLPAGSKFEVYTASGDQVTEIDNLSGNFTWDVRNSAGEKLGSGVFLWYVRLADKTVSGKLIVQR